MKINLFSLWTKCTFIHRLIHGPKVFNVLINMSAKNVLILASL